MRSVLLILAGVAVLVPTLLALSAWATLDRGRAHSAATARLPLFDRAAEDGLVRIPAGGFEFRARVAGMANDGPGLILLHGFPETSVMWQPLVDAAAASGFRVIAFDQRGYSPGARPEGVEHYHVDSLIEDLLAVADVAGFDRFHLGVHDWGAVVGWIATSRHPERVESLIALSIPHPGAIPDPSVPPTTPTYVRVFKMPGVAETLLGYGRRRMLHSAVYASMDQSHRDEYEAVFSEPGALSAALNWYRAMDPSNLSEADSARVSQPVLYVWGRKDMPVYVGPSVQARVPDFVTGPFESIPLDAGHWLIQDEEKAVVEAALGHLERLR